MKVYLRVFINYEKDNQTRLLPMAEFAYNNAKNASIGYRFFELNCRYHLYVSYKEDVDPCPRLKAANKLTKKLRNLMATCWKNLQHDQKPQKQSQNMRTKPKSYSPGKKIWLNSNILKSNTIKSWKQSFLGLFNFYTQWVTKPTNSNYRNNRGFITFSICPR